MQYKLTTPVTREDLALLKAGDTVLLSGGGVHRPGTPPTSG